MLHIRVGRQRKGGEKREEEWEKREEEWERGAAKKALQLCATGERAVLPQPMLQLAANVAKKRWSAGWQGGGREISKWGKTALSSCHRYIDDGVCLI